MDPDADYVCTLDPVFEKKAKDELNEIPADRMAAVKALRDWIESQPHIKTGKLGKCIHCLMYMFIQSQPHIKTGKLGMCIQCLMYKLIQ